VLKLYLFTSRNKKGLELFLPSRKKREVLALRCRSYLSSPRKEKYVGTVCSLLERSQKSWSCFSSLIEKKKVLELLLFPQREKQGVGLVYPQVERREVLELSLLS